MKTAKQIANETGLTVEQVQGVLDFEAQYEAKEKRGHWTTRTGEVARNAHIYESCLSPTSKKQESVKNDVKEIADGLQSLLDDCAFHGATLDACTCADFEQSGDCEHVDTLHTFKGFYSTNFHHIKRNGVTVNAYRVKWHEVSQRMIVIPEPEGKVDYTTTLHSCTCPDFEYRGGSYLGTDGKRICKHIHSLRQNAPAFALPVPAIA